jgi:ABC-type transport system involved in cytochrome bd biosynthesis fused ATPase/permease subunit
VERPPFGVVLGAMFVTIFIIATFSLAVAAPEVGATILVLALLLLGLLFIPLHRQQRSTARQEIQKDEYKKSERR